MRVFEHRHVVCFEDTNVAGNVYFVNHLRWQGRCREMFLRRHAPELVQRLGRDLSIVTVRCSCEYFLELFVHDEIVVQMRPGAVSQGRLAMQFEYWRVTNDGLELVARGEQEVACMQRLGVTLTPAAWPQAFTRVIEQFAEAPEVCA